MQALRRIVQTRGRGPSGRPAANVVQSLPMLEIDQLACQRGERLLFRRLGFALAAGELLRVQGANGMGKTSLLRQLAGLAAVEAGQIRWRGESIRAQREAYHAELLFLSHAPALNDLLDPVENLSFACAATGRPIARTDATDALRRIGLARQLDLPCKLLSQGQRRRVLLARLFLRETPVLWLLDEPFTALDVAAVGELAECLVAHAERGGLAIFTTHQDVTLRRPVRLLDLAEYAG